MSKEKDHLESLEKKANALSGKTRKTFKYESNTLDVLEYKKQEDDKTERNESDTSSGEESYSEWFEEGLSKE